MEMLYISHFSNYMTITVYKNCSCSFRIRVYDSKFVFIIRFILMQIQELNVLKNCYVFIN
jgi:hypothetical protein